MKQSAVVIFPGRGTYGKDELGYLARHHGDKAAFIKGVDEWRASQGRETVSALDNAKSYSAAKHASSINASALIYTCALADFAASMTTASRDELQEVLEARSVRHRIEISLELLKKEDGFFEADSQTLGSGGFG